MKICSNCNTYVDDNATSCSNCGALFFANEEEYNQYLQQQNEAAQSPAPASAPAPAPVTKAKKPINKKLIAIIAAVVVVIAIIAIVALSGGDGGSGDGGSGNPGVADQLAKLNPSDGLEFTSNGDGTCTLTGIGTCTDTTIVIPEKNNGETVTAVGEVDCSYDATFTKVILADTITTIGEWGFYHCKSLEEVVLNEGLKEIGEDAFSHLENLKAINFPSTLETIGEYAFMGCTALTEAHLNEGLKTVDNAFADCTAIQKLTIPSTIQHEISFIFDFSTTSLTEINIPDCWKYIYFNTDEDYDTGKLSSDDRIVTSLSYVEYPGFYHEISPENFALTITNMSNKKTLTVNGTLVDKSTIKPVGKYILPEFYGPVEREFTAEGNVIYSWHTSGYSDTDYYPDVCTSPFTYNEELNMFTSNCSATVEGEVFNFDTYILNYGDYLLIVNSEDTLKDGEVYISYEQYMKEFVGDIDLSGVSTDKLEEIEAKKTDLLAELVAEFNAAGISVTVNETTGELAMDSSVLFGGDSSELTPDGAAFIDKFIGIYTRVIFSEKYNGFVSKTLVEGHTAPTGTSYEADLPLSEARANSVLNYCKSSASATNPEQVASTFEAVGLSNSKPIYTSSGTVDMDASRRVAFKLVLNIQ